MGKQRNLKQSAFSDTELSQCQSSFTSATTERARGGNPATTDLLLAVVCDTMAQKHFHYRATASYTDMFTINKKIFY